MFTFSSADTWNDAVRRGMYMPADRLVASMTGNVSLRRLLVANPYRSRPVRIARHSIGQRDAPFAAGVPGRTLLQPLRTQRRHPTRISDIERLYLDYDSHLRRAADGMGMERPVVITCNPFAAAFSPFEWAGPVTFYAFDDWAAYPAHEPWWPAYEHAYAAVARLGRRVCAVSQAIVDHVAPTGPYAVVPNGLAPDEWEPPWDVPPWFPSLPAPQILYVGTLDGRLDTDAVVATARSFPEGSVVLVGPITDPQAVEPLRDIPNLHIKPPMGRREVAGLVHHADVCLLPHRRTPLTRAMSPLKLYEYLAGGRPVAASDLPPVRALDDDRVVLVAETGDFAQGVATALRKGPSPEDQRRAFIDRNSWAQRHRAILDLARRE